MHEMSAWARSQQLEPDLLPALGGDCSTVIADLSSPAVAKSKIEECQFSEEERAARRKGILALQAEMMKAPDEMPQPEHFFAPGVYARQQFLPKGSLVVGKIHRHAHINIISYGRVKVSTEFGPMIIEGPHTFTSQPGTKRVVLAEEDTLWTTIHVTEETDLAKIEDYVIAPSYDAIGMDDPCKQIEEGEPK